MAAACRERANHHFLRRADDASSVISNRSSAAAARYSRRKALEVELERLKLEHDHAERQRQLQVTHEQECFKDEQEQLMLKREIDVLDEQDAQFMRMVSYTDPTLVRSPPSIQFSIGYLQTAHARMMKRLAQTTCFRPPRGHFSCPTTFAHRSRCSHRCECSASCRRDSTVPSCKAVQF
ncbi:hypothetical protein M514_09942 [Trichuris suis]|uniref:Uncharacterized protein n=1 Tax=Trichuris suis TaxID=68888 RepID=A0A085MUM2_9BILA|nr:hypothetical protein M513_09942 [Trichuris suis]KFD60918.1 hypothetical protein M514_09942 [Trichuris suis]